MADKNKSNLDNTSQNSASGDVQNPNHRSNKPVLFMLFSLGFVAVFFMFVFLLNQGPIDNVEYEWGDTFTMEQKASRDKVWRTSTESAIEKGKKLYEVNAIGDVGEFFTQIKQGEYGSSEVEIYKALTNGVSDPRFHSLEYFPSQVRWSLTHYIRSEMSNPKIATLDEWQSLDEEGI